MDSKPLTDEYVEKLPVKSGTYCTMIVAIKVSGGSRCSRLSCGYSDRWHCVTMIADWLQGNNLEMASHRPKAIILAKSRNVIPMHHGQTDNNPGQHPIPWRILCYEFRNGCRYQKDSKAGFMAPPLSAQWKQTFDPVLRTGALWRPNMANGD